MFLEVILLEWVKLLGASRHYLAVPGNDVSLVEVVDVVSKRSVI